jgi:hypothetical protein
MAAITSVVIRLQPFEPSWPPCLVSFYACALLVAHLDRNRPCLNHNRGNLDGNRGAAAAVVPNMISSDRNHKSGCCSAPAARSSSNSGRRVSHGGRQRA